jgi:nucleoside-diphosphate-sugar epimerase
MQILITGGAGFIGSHLAERLLAEGHAVAILDDFSTGSPENLAEARRIGGSRLTVTEGSVIDAALVGRLVAGADHVIHLAAAVGVKLIMEAPSRGILTNVVGTERVLEACLARLTPVFVASTSEVYGKATKFPFSEGDDVVIGATKNLRWSYAAAKLIDEFLALALHREKGLKATCLRFFNTTGPRQTGRYGMVLPSFVTAALNGEPLMVHGDGSQSRCFCHVKDVIEALVRLLASPAVPGEVVNIGTEEETTILGLAEKVKRLTGSASGIRLVPYAEAYGPGFEDMARRVPDLARLEGLTGFRPKTPLSAIIADVIAEKRAALAG